MEAIHFFETSVYTLSTRYHIQEDGILESKSNLPIYILLNSIVTFSLGLRTEEATPSNGAWLPTYRICKFEQPIRSDPQILRMRAGYKSPLCTIRTCISMDTWEIKYCDLVRSCPSVLSSPGALTCSSCIIGIDLSLAAVTSSHLVH
jgi:hypothetical protein